MREYFKILSSISLALLSLGLILNIVTLIVNGYSYYNSENSEFVFGLGITWVFAWVGFLMFGILGSLFWRFYLKIFNNSLATLFHKHIYSSLLASFTCVSIFAFTQINRGIIEVAKVYLFLVMVLPVVFVSLIIYRKLYLVCKT